jgi:ElaB/YqjD/DUF883 family membrane-anchored ribosome-binding protein
MSTITQQAGDPADAVGRGDVGDRMEDVVDYLGTQLAAAGKAAAELVRAKPWRVAGVVALVAIAAGILLVRRGGEDSRR